MPIADVPLNGTPARRTGAGASDFSAAVVTADHDLSALRRALHDTRNNWRTDRIEPEFEHFMATITATPDPLRRHFGPPPTAQRTNAWRDTMEAWERVVNA